MKTSILFVTFMLVMSGIVFSMSIDSIKVQIIFKVNKRSEFIFKVGNNTVKEFTVYKGLYEKSFNIEIDSFDMVTNILPITILKDKGYFQGYVPIIHLVFIPDSCKMPKTLVIFNRSKNNFFYIWTDNIKMLKELYFQIPFD